MDSSDNSYSGPDGFSGPEPDPFDELRQLTSGEKMEAEINLMNAIEDYIAVGGHHDDIIRIVEDIV